MNTACEQHPEACHDSALDLNTLTAAFGDWQRCQHTQQVVGCVDLTPHWQGITASGPDAARYLHNRTCNDVTALTSALVHPASEPTDVSVFPAQWNAALQKNAAVDGLFLVAPTIQAHQPPDTPIAFTLLCEAAQVTTTLDALNRFKILEQVTFTPWQPASMIALFGLDAATLIAQAFSLDPVMLWTLPAMQGVSFSFGEHVVSILPFPTPVVDHPSADKVMTLAAMNASPVGFLLWSETLSVSALQLALQNSAQEQGIIQTHFTDAHWHWATVTSGIPLTQWELTPTVTTLAQLGWADSAASSTKGCYLGQETLAKLKTYGSAPQMLMGVQVTLDNPLATVPSPGAPWRILAADTLQPMGELTRLLPALSTYWGMAMLDRASRTPDIPQAVLLKVAEEAIPATLTVRPFPLAVLSDGTTREQLATTALSAGLDAFAQHQDTQAQNFLAKAIGLNPLALDAYEALAVILGRQARYPEAIALLKRLEALAPEHHMTQTNLSVFYMKLGDKEAAEEAKAKGTVLVMRQKMQAAGLKTPANAAAQADALTEKQAKLRERIAMFQEALAFRPDDPLGNFGLGSAYMELGEPQQAVEPLALTVAKDPNHTAAFQLLGQAYEATHQPQAAIATYTQGIAVAAKRGDKALLAKLEARLAALQT